MSKPASHERDQQILDLLDGNLPEDQQSELRNWLDQSSKHYDRFVELSFLHSQLAGQLNSQRSAKDIRLESLQAVPFEKHAELPPIHLDATTLTKQKYASALSYVLRHTFKPRRVAVLAIAAALLLGVTLLVVFIGDNDTANTTPELASPPREPGRDGPAHNQALSRPIVGTLTYELDAVWSLKPGESLRSGSALASGQRLILTAGLAEIRTNDGAVAIIEAPATIELINNDNAIRLHAGKLVGVCETESSKGFLVRTPHMDVTDLGTRFGIDADSRATEVHVFEGEVKTLRPDAPEGVEPIALVAGQSVRTSADSQAITTVDQAVDRFAALMPEAVRPETVAGWQIIAINGEALESPGAMRIAKPAKGSHWITADQSYPQQVNDETTFTVQTRFDLLAGTDHDSAAMLLRFDANDRVTQVRLNGRPYTPPTNYKDDGHDGMHTMRIDGPLLAAENTLQLDVVDVRRAGATKWEVRVDWSFEPAQDQSEP